MANQKLADIFFNDLLAESDSSLNESGLSEVVQGNILGIASAIRDAWTVGSGGSATLPMSAIRTIGRTYGLSPTEVANAVHALGGNVPRTMGDPAGMARWANMFNQAGAGGGQVAASGGQVAAKGAASLAAKKAALAKAAALKAGAGGGAGGLGVTGAGLAKLAGAAATAAAPVAGVALAGAAARAGWNIWHSKFRPQSDALQKTVTGLLFRTRKLNAPAFSAAMQSFNNRFTTAMQGAAFTDSDRVISGQALVLIDFYNNLADTMNQVANTAEAKAISGKGGKVAVSGNEVKIVEQPGLQEQVSLQELELFNRLFGRKKQEPQFQSGEEGAENTEASEKEEKKDSGNFETNVQRVLGTLRTGALSGRPSSFTGAIKNAWATIGFKPEKTKMPPEFNDKAIDSLMASLLNTLLAPAGAGKTIKEFATELKQVYTEGLIKVEIGNAILNEQVKSLLSEDIAAFMQRTPVISGTELEQQLETAAEPPPPEIKQVVDNVKKEEPSAEPPAAAGGGAGGEAPTAPAKAPKAGAPKAAPGPTGPKLLDDATLRKLAPQALQLFQNQTQNRKKFAAAAAAGNLKIGSKAIRLTPEQSNQLIDFIKGSVGADRSGGKQVKTGGQGVDMVGPNSSVAASLQDPTLMKKNVERMNFIKSVTPKTGPQLNSKGEPIPGTDNPKIGIQSFLQAAKAAVKDENDPRNLKIQQYDITLNPQQQTQARALGLLERLYRLLGLQNVLSERIAKLVNAKKIIKESARISNINDRLDVLVAYERQVEKSLNETVERIRMLTIPVGIRFYA